MVVAMAANIQAVFSSFFTLPADARYPRNREAPFVGADGQLYTAWRHAPR